MKPILSKPLRLAPVHRLAGPLTLAIAFGIAGPLHATVAKAQSAAAQAGTEAEASASAGNGQTQNKQIIIERIEPDGQTTRTGPKTVTWLGIGTEETSDALAAQLSLKPGEGLVVSFVAPDSPAAKAGLEKNDVLVQLDGQLLVHPAQLRKLVQMHNNGDTVKIELFRAGKKQTLQASLGQTSRPGLFDDGSWQGDLRELQQRLQEFKGRDLHSLDDQMRALKESLAKAGLDRETVKAEVQRSLEQARRAAEQALRQTGKQLRATGGNLKVLEELARSGVGLDHDSTVVIQRYQPKLKTAVKTDDTGTYVIVANPTKRLMAHSPDGKLLFDGEIETPEQQAKVPKEVWTEVEPMLKQMAKPEGNNNN